MTELYLGTYTSTLPHVVGRGRGIMRAELTTGPAWAVTEPTVLAAPANPSWLCATTDGRTLFALLDPSEPGHPRDSRVAAYARDPASGALTLLAERSTGGRDAAWVMLDATERFVLVANYTTGTLVSYHRDPEQGLGEECDRLQCTGTGPNPLRQEAAHPHQLVRDPVTDWFAVPDLGADLVRFVALNPAGAFSEAGQPALRLPPGSGPRHLAFHPDRRTAFVVSELTATVAVFARASETEPFEVTPRAVHAMLPPGHGTVPGASAIRVTPSGCFVYAANRGHDSIAMFRWEAGHLHPLGTEPTRGACPREMIVTPCGTGVLVGNQDSHTVELFAIDPESGRLNHRASTPVGSPVCLLPL